MNQTAVLLHVLGHRITKNQHFCNRVEDYENSEPTLQEEIDIVFFLQKICVFWNELPEAVEKQSLGVSVKQFHPGLVAAH